MATAVSICSNALMRLGAESFSSFSEGSDTGDNVARVRLCENLWSTVRRQVLRSHSWSDATKRVIISPDVTSPEFGYNNRFLRPSDWLRTIAVSTPDGYERSIDYKIEGGYFLCDESALYLVYLFDNTDPVTYGSSLVEVMELAMMARLAYPVTKSTSLASEITAELERLLVQARGLDTGDDSMQTLGDMPLLSSRYSGRHGRSR